jgi:peptide/nickel transport system substrate-binding protein
VVRGLGLGVGGLALAACSGPAAAPTPAAAPAAPAPPAAGGQPAASPSPAARQPKLGGAFRGSGGQSEAPHLDPHQTNSGPLFSWGAGMAWSQLVTFKAGPGVSPPDYEPVGDLAESWTQPDDTTYLFKLRPGVKFHNIPPVNGREVDAEDVVQSFRRQIDLKINANALDGVLRIEAPDRATVRIVRDKPSADFLWNLASFVCKVLPKELFGSGDLKEGPVIGSGPFISANWEKGRVYTLKRNPDFYQKGKPYMDEVQWLRIGDAATYLSAFRSKNMDVIHVGLLKSDADTLKKENPQIDLQLRGDGVMFEVGLKGDRPPFNDPRVRQAVSKAINRQEIIDTLLSGAAKIDTQVTVPSPQWALPQDEVKRALAYDPEGAKRLLQEAGVSRLDLEFQVGDYLAGLFVQVGELMQAQLRRVNIDTTIKVVDGATFVTQIRTQGNYIIYLGSPPTPSTTSNELLTRWHSKGPQFTTGVPDAELDGLIERQALQVRDAAARRGLVQQILRKMLTLNTLIPVFQQARVIVLQPYVQDWNPNPGSNTHSDYLGVWLDN